MLVGIGLLGVLLFAVIPFGQRLSQDITNGWPHIQLVIGQDRSDTTRNAHDVGANYVDYKDDSPQYTNIPSLQGLWQLDEPYAHKSNIEIEKDTDYISIFCASGRLRSLPNDISIVRFDASVVEGEPGSSPDWADGETISYERHGNFYRIYDPAPGVYVARTVWEHGVIESGWLVTTK